MTLPNADADGNSPLHILEIQMSKTLIALLAAASFLSFGAQAADKAADKAAKPAAEAAAPAADAAAKPAKKAAKKHAKKVEEKKADMPAAK